MPSAANVEKKSLNMGTFYLQTDNLAHNQIDTKDQIKPEDLKQLQSQLHDIQAKFKAESKDHDLLVKNLRAWTKCHEHRKTIDETIRVAKEVRENFDADAFVLIGIGGSDLGARTLHAALNHTQHNLVSKKKRGGAPLVFFTGDTFEPNELHDIIDVLEEKNLLPKTIFNVISKSGTTSETISAFLILKERLQKKLKELGRDPKEYGQNIVATTGLNDKSELYRLNQRDGLRAVLPVPDGVGGRFSFSSPVGLLLLGVTTNTNDETIEQRVEQAVAGMAEAERCGYLDTAQPENVAYQLAAVNFLAEQHKKTSIVFYPYSKILRSLADWYAQLSTESIQKKGQGQNVIPTCGPIGNHSILNGILEGGRDKFVVFVRVNEFNPQKDFTVPSGSGIGGELTVLEGKQMSAIQNFSQKGTEINFTDNGILNVTLHLPKVDTFHVFLLMCSLEIATTVEGKLRGLEYKGKDGDIKDLTYEQAGVDGYKKETRRLLAES